MSVEDIDEPGSPFTRMMQTPGYNLCILAFLGFKTRIDVNLFINDVQQTLLKHPRFSSLLITNNEKTDDYSWRRTTVDIGNHVFAVDLDPTNMESPDEFVENFMSDLSRNPMNPAKPLWEFYVLNVKTSKANSTVIFRTHHSMGDGVSLISLLLACAAGQKVSDSSKYLPDVLPSSSKKRELADHADGLMKWFFFRVWTVFSIIFNTLSDLLSLLATSLFLKDTKTPIKGERGIEISRKRYVHRIISLDDVKLVKNAMNVSINDVMLGVTEAGVGRYLNMIYARSVATTEKRIRNGEQVIVKKANYLPKNLRIRSAVAFNLRPSPTIKELAEIMEKGKDLNGMWGNIVGFALLPLTINDLQDDPLACIRRAKATMDQKKLSFSPKCSYLLIKLLIKLLGPKVTGAVVNMLFCNTTLATSNVAGPREEVTLFGHSLSYIAPSVSGFPVALVIHFQSYANKLIISIAADDNLIPNPHQLCDDLVSSLGNIKETIMKNVGSFKGSKFL